MSRESRRKILKGLAFTAPAAWSAPLVKSVILPAHAETSGGETIVCDTITASSVFDHPEIDQRSLAIFDSEFNIVNNDCCESPLQVSASGLEPGTYFVSMGTESPRDPALTVLTVETCTSSCEVAREISGGDADGSGEAMVQITLPGGECEEVSIDPFPPEDE